MHLLIQLVHVYYMNTHQLTKTHFILTLFTHAHSHLTPILNCQFFYRMLGVFLGTPPIKTGHNDIAKKC